MQHAVETIVAWILEKAGTERFGFLHRLPMTVWYLVFMLLFAFIVLNFVAAFAGIATYVERKIAAHMQHRLGPMRVGFHGILQFLADGVKLVQKEDIIPAAADSILFRAAPYLVFTGAFAMFAVMPFGRALNITNLNIGLFYVLAVGSLVVMGILMGGWCSGNKWSLFGAMRSVAQIVSYEIPVGICLLTVAMMAGTLNLNDIVDQQAAPGLFHLGGVFGWNVFRYLPFTAILFLILFIGSLAETNRTPFDLPEAESELVSGYHTEYSGMRFSFFFMAEYADMLAVSGIGAAAFLGGWQSPFGHPLLPGIFAVGEGVVWFLAKAFFLIFVMMWLRWSLPRYRVDQLMYLCWKVLLPWSIACMLGVGVWMLLA